MKTIVSITDPLEMAGFIKSNGTQCRFVSLVSKTPVVKIKVGNPFGQIIRKGKVVGECRLWKVSRKNGIVNANYNTSVRRRIAERTGVELKEVEYENGETWYQHLMTAGETPKPLPLVEHKIHHGKLYLQYFTHKSVNAFVNHQNEVVDDTLVEPWLYAEKEQDEFKPCVIVIGLENIKEIRASGVIMEAEDLAEAEAALSV